VCSDRSMNVAENSDRPLSHPFGGCNRLLDQYQMTGRALLAYERSVVCAPLIPSPRSMREFSTSVAFVPVEVLETYLDDLLDLGVSDEGLFIKKSKTSWRGRVLLGILIAAVVGSLFVLHGDLTAAAMPALFAITFLAGIASTLYFLPRTKVIRRFGFATLVSHEIGTRRGQGKAKVGNFAARFLMGDMWKLQDYSASKRLPPQPARVGMRYFH
jgi:hypothetical protein